MTYEPLQNLLLTALPDYLAHRLRSHLHLMTVSVGDVLFQTGRSNEHVYFPLTSIISIQVLHRDGVTNEIGTVGNEGFVGATLFLASNSFQSRAVVRGAGQAYRLPTHLFQQTFAGPGPWMQKLQRFTQTLMIQSAQTAACNRHHSIEQQLCRLLLSSQDRQLADPLRLTHDMIASLLGVRREGISEAAGKLQSARLIQYSHGKITLTHRAGLEQRACDCYNVIRFALNRLIASEDSDNNHVADCPGTAYI